MSTPDELRAQAAFLEAKAAAQEQPLTPADVHKLYQERRYEEIEQARKDGRIEGLVQA